MTASHLFPREGRLALLPERPAALDEVAAGEAVLHHLGAARHVALGFVLHHLADDVLDRLHRDRRVDGDGLGVILHVGFELGLRYHPIHEPHQARLLGVELARGEEYLTGEGGADDVDEAPQAGIGIAQPELRRRHREARIVRADAQVAAHREPDPAADAIAANHGDGGLGKILHARIGLLDRYIVVPCCVAGAALAFEFRNVGAVDESLAARAGQHDDANVVVLGEVLENPARRRPHVERYRVMTLGIVEDHVADAPVLAREHLVGLGHVVHRLSSAASGPIPKFVSARGTFRYELRNLRTTSNSHRFTRQIALLWRSAAISLALNPNSLSTASVCSPSPGGAATSRLGVRDSDTGWPAMRRFDSSLVFTFCAMPRCSTCGSA